LKDEGVHYPVEKIQPKSKRLNELILPEPGGFFFPTPEESPDPYPRFPIQVQRWYENGMTKEKSHGYYHTIAWIQSGQ
jgi:hypothetical protein